VHHETELSEEIKASIRAFTDDLMLGPTGQFLEGQLTPNDKGELVFAVGELKGKVIINFGGPVASVGMSPKQARELARSLRQRANRIERGTVGYDRHRRNKSVM